MVGTNCNEQLTCSYIAPGSIGMQDRRALFSPARTLYQEVNPRQACRVVCSLRCLVLDLRMVPVVPPKSTRVEPSDYDRALYKERNEIERLFRRLKGFRRIFSRFEKLDVPLRQGKTLTSGPIPLAGFEVTTSGRF
jgi:transposase